MTDSRCLLASTNEWAQHNSDIGRDSRSRMCDVTYVPEAKSERRTMRYKKKESELNHPHFVAVRLSNVELHLLDQSASALGISISEYLRKVLTEKEIQNRIEIVTDMESLRKLVSEYGKIGSNLNQIARYFNSGRERSLAIESEIHQCIAELFQLRKQVLQMVGETNGSS